MFTRVITEHGPRFDDIKRGMPDPSLEVVPLSFPVREHRGLTLNLLRLSATRSGFKLAGRALTTSWRSRAAQSVSVQVAGPSRKGSRRCSGVSGAQAAALAFASTSAAGISAWAAQSWPLVGDVLNQTIEADR
ncbi:MAG: 2'-deoxycytidine 5'-triphosphate deaminase [Actinomycetota bacterium]|nr:2'-deoxycytidine 5'-triphosphate deaminase [Actinomycetota bacterium]